MHKIYEPYLPDKSLEYAKQAIDSKWVSSLGQYPEKSSRILGEKLGVKYALPVNNGTSATHLTTISLRKFFPSINEIIVPSACYVAAYNSLVYEGYKNIIAADLNIDTWNMSVDEVKLNKNSAIMAVHNLGGIINVPKLSRKYNSPIIEDNCEGFFGRYEGNSSGSKSFCSALSFFGNKNITSGEGGAFLTNEKDVYEYALKVHGQGQTETRYIHDVLGYNYRMTNVQAGLLLGQLEDYEYIYSEKKRVFNRYVKNLKNQSYLSLQSIEEDCDHSMWMLGVRFHCAESFSKSSAFFNSKNIETRPMFYSYNKHLHLSIKGPHSNSDILQDQIVIFPSHIFLKNEDIDEICDRIIAYNSLVFQNWADKNDLI